MKNIQSRMLRLAVLTIALSASAVSVQAGDFASKKASQPNGCTPWAWCMSFCCGCICNLFCCGSSSSSSTGGNSTGINSTGISVS